MNLNLKENCHQAGDMYSIVCAGVCVCVCVTNFFFFGLHKGRGGVYGFVWELIDDGEYAHLLDNTGHYSLDWQAAVEQYYEHQKSQRSQQKPFNRKDASNKLRGALLNFYAKDGAKEYKEARRLNDRNEVIERQFQMPKRIFKELRSGNMEEEISSDNSSFEVQTVLCHVLLELHNKLILYVKLLHWP